MCGDKLGDDIHHLKHQRTATKDKFIEHFHKNHKANLINLCKDCHNKIHETGEQHRLVKTSAGMQIMKTT